MTGGLGGSGGRRKERLIPVLPRAAWVVLGGDFVSAIGSGLTLPCLFIYAHQVRHLSDAASGLVVATIALASLVGNPVGGALADRWTARRTLMAGLVVAAVGSIALALAQTAFSLFGAAGLLGLGVSVIWPAQDTLLASLVDSASRSAVFSVRHASMNAGLGLGAVSAAAVVTVAHPGTFVAVYLADAVTFLAFVPVLACLPATPRHATERDPAGQGRIGFLQVLRDKAFLRVWVLTALLVTVSFGQYQSTFAGFATRPGGIDARGLCLAFAANTLTVVGAQLFVLRRLAGHRRTTGVALAAAAWAATWVVVIAAGHLGGGAGAEIGFAAAMVIFAIGESLLSPTLPAIINDLAPPQAAGRYNGLGVMAFTVGFLVGPAGGAAALGVGWGNGLFIVAIGTCLLAGAAALRLGRHLPLRANQIAARETFPAAPTEPESLAPSLPEPAMSG
jgi:MFS family permease